MKSRPLASILFPAFLGAILLCTLGMTAYAIYFARDFYIDHTAATLQSRARLVEQDILAVGVGGMGDAAATHRRVRTIAEASGVRVTIIDATGKVLAESEVDSDVGNHANRPEFIDAMRQDRGQAVRYSDTLKAQWLYGAVRGKDAAGNTVVYRTAAPLTEINTAMRDISLEIVIAAAGLSLIAAAAGAVLVRRITRPLREMAQGARKLSAGEFAQRLPGSPVREFSELAGSLQSMARRLDQEIRALTAQRNEREAILTGMIEGVLAVDLDQRVMSINRAAAEMIGAAPQTVVGKGLSEAVRNLALAEFLERVLSGEQNVEEEISLRRHAGQELFISARGAALTADGRQIGALLVLHDTTQLHQLETIRRDFVANVSHELKTPITSIKGWVETLRDGAIGDPADAAKSLEIIARQADRLNQIIDDLLALSHIERDAQSHQVAMERGEFAAVLGAAAEDCRKLATSRNVQIELDCPTDLNVTMNSALIEQAVVNLLDNAIKYSPPGSHVAVVARTEGPWAMVEVKDQGVGISAEHLERIFERFYRVDKARSREQGGTGLGLAIVKHIAQAHGGKVGVESTPGKGSAFRIYLPMSSERTLALATKPPP